MLFGFARAVVNINVARIKTEVEVLSVKVHIGFETPILIIWGGGSLLKDSSIKMITFSNNIFTQKLQFIFFIKTCKFGDFFMPCAKPKRVYFNPCIIQAVQGRTNNPITGVTVNKRIGRTDWQGVDNIGSTLGKPPQKVI